jgi:SAM-dependent methyltransferase
MTSPPDEPTSSLTRPAWEVVADLTGIAPGIAVLDVGCGTGGFSRLAAARGADVHGVDAAHEHVAEARRRLPSGDFRVAFMEDLPWERDTFDVVTGFNALQYALDIDLALAEALRVARPGGQVAVCKYGRPAENEFFAFLAALDPERVQLGALPEQDPVDAILDRRGYPVRAAGEVSTAMTLPSADSLATAVLNAGARTGNQDFPAWRAQVMAAAAPYRRPRGTYRLESRLAYRILTA